MAQQPKSPIRSALLNLLGAGTCPSVERAQIEQLRSRIPVLYLTIGANIAALACTHFSDNPLWQVVVLPVAVLLAMSVRMIWWIRLKPDQLSADQVHRTLRNLSVAAAVAGFLILIWALSLHDAKRFSLGMTTAGHVIFFVEITFICCTSLLMHHRFAAILVGVSIVVPFTIYLLSLGRLIETAIALNTLLVSSSMLYVAVSFSRHFERSVIAASELVRLSASNARIAASDALTGLPNRRQFFAEIDGIGKGDEDFAVIVLDLDGFKPVNDVYGHHAGDEVLRQVAARFVALAPEGCCIARLGGDEFGCVLPGASMQAAREVADRMIAACAEPIVTATFTALVDASAGLCSSSVARQSIKAYERADYALFQAKRSGRGRVVAFDAAHESSMRRDSAVAHHLSTADFEGEVTAIYQPIVAAGNHEITAFEALVRWCSPELGQVAPEEFIPIAERTDLIFRISLRVFNHALLQAETWPEAVCLKVNLSVRDLMSSKQTEALVAMVRLSDVDPSRVTFEITETILAESMELIRANVDIVRAAGCKIAIDDFGVGYSSLNYIHALAPDIIKIDRCFIAQSTTNDTTKRVIRTIIELARNVGAVSVAEGVQTGAEAELLAELGCDELQGYYFSRPIPAEISTTMALTRRVTGSASPIGAVVGASPAGLTDDRRPSVLPRRVVAA